MIYSIPKVFRGVVVLALVSFLGGLLPIQPAQAQSSGPGTVSIPGTLQSELGCPGDWQPECDKTFLNYDAEDDVWQGVFLWKVGNDQDGNGPRYKVAIDGSWSENYGAKAQAGGADIPLIVNEPTQVKFYYDHKTHWVTDNVNSVIAVAMGTFQDELGCKQDNDAGCLRSWLQDLEGSGIYSFSTRDLPAGEYEFRIALYESADQWIGANGEVNGAAVSFTIPQGSSEIYISFDPATNAITVSTTGAPRGNITKQTAHWVTRDTILWKLAGPSPASFELHYAAQGGLVLEADGISGGMQLPLEISRSGPSMETRIKFPHLASFSALKLDAVHLGDVPEILRGQLAVLARDAQGRVLGATGVQIPGVLDDLLTYDGPLGVSFESGSPVLRLWAPTARSVVLHLFTSSTGAEYAQVPMRFDAEHGVWSVMGEPGWKNLFYLFEVEVFVPSTGKMEKNLVTDPYSFSLSTNSLRSQIVDLADAALKPAGWSSLEKPNLEAFEDSVIYELHIRDFSIFDETVPQELRGTYLAFAVPGSQGMAHLKDLSQAGVTHIHLLPAFDIASIDEDKSTWINVDPVLLGSYPPDSDQQQLALAPYKDQDGFNWGYDPLHFTTPEGSYATDPDGSARVKEFRQMVQALNRAGLRVVMDVVYNHTNASGQNPKSVLDKIVPGYYHRLSAEGNVEKSTCCENTATEHAMMEKLMIDSLRTWATQYQVDGFRFDLMGHHMLSNMLAVRQALDALTLEEDGVDGKKILLYGEGWNFGEVANGARGQNATQSNMGGSGIATFNDRLRDAARGGGPFSPVQQQGFITGLFTAPNDYEQGSLDSQRSNLLRTTGWLINGLAGNLAGFTWIDPRGVEVTGKQVDYNGSPTGYTADPQENIVYISAHDNETLFDAIQYKAPASATIQDRARMNTLGLSLVMLSQGIPFFHAGDDLLRSKSLDGNSYNSGDWFNRLDFSYQTNNWGAGLPDFRRDSWTLMASLLGDPDLKPSPADIRLSADIFQELLRIRKSTALFRLQTAEQVEQKLDFLNTGAEQTPGLIVMLLDDTQGVDLDPKLEKMIVLFNAQREPVTFTASELAAQEFQLHRIQAGSSDPQVRDSLFDAEKGSFFVPGRTAAVFVLEQPGVEVSPWLGLGSALGAMLVVGMAAWLFKPRSPN